jgi:hypothetical protein
MAWLTTSVDVAPPNASAPEATFVLSCPIQPRVASPAHRRPDRRRWRALYAAPSSSSTGTPSSASSSRRAGQGDLHLRSVHEGALRLDVMRSRATRCGRRHVDASALSVDQTLTGLVGNLARSRLGRLRHPGPHLRDKLDECRPNPIEEAGERRCAQRPVNGVHVALDGVGLQHGTRHPIIGQARRGCASSLEAQGSPTPAAPWTPRDAAKGWRTCASDRRIQQTTTSFSDTPRPDTRSADRSWSDVAFA